MDLHTAPEGLPGAPWHRWIVDLRGLLVPEHVEVLLSRLAHEDLGREQPRQARHAGHGRRRPTSPHGEERYETQAPATAVQI